MGRPVADALDTGRALDVAREAARAAIDVLVEARERSGLAAAEEKESPRDLVTEADREAERRIVARIREAYPDHAILAEEGTGDAPSPDGGAVGDGEAAHEVPSRTRFRWIVDPLDGTTNYVHDLPVWAVSIALFEGDEPRVGVVVDPSREEWFTARAGYGAHVDRGDPEQATPITVSEIDDPARAILATGFPFRRPDELDRYLDAFRDLFRRVSDMRRAGSAAIDMAWLAAGRIEGFWEIGLSLWDIAAGEVLVREAGGRVSDWSGGATHREHGWIAAGNPALHDVLVETLRGYAE